jgi:hypothetical protein
VLVDDDERVERLDDRADAVGDPFERAHELVRA